MSLVVTRQTLAAALNRRTHSAHTTAPAAIGYFVVVGVRAALTVSLAALQVGWALEDRGFRLRPLGDKLQVQPHQRLTADDVAAIKAHRDELLALVKYDAPPCA